MAKIIKKQANNKYLIRYVPQGYRDLFPKQPYRHITIVGKSAATKIVNKLTAIENVDINQRKLGLTPTEHIAKEIDIKTLFNYFTKQYMPYAGYADSTKRRYLGIMNKLCQDLGSAFLFKDIVYSLLISKYATGKRNQCLTMIKCINNIREIGRKAIAEEITELTAYKISGQPIKTPKVAYAPKNPLTLDQLNSIYSNPNIEEVTKDIIRLYIITGCRRSELCRPYFTWDQIDEDKGVAYIRNKGNKSQHSKLFEIPWLQQHQLLIKRISDYYKDWHELSDQYPIPITCQSVFDRIKAASKISKIPFTPHDLRDTGATLILRSTNNIYAAKEFCGHKSVRDTERSYADYNISDKANATGKLLKHLGNLSN